MDQIVINPQKRTFFTKMLKRLNLGQFCVALMVKLFPKKKLGNKTCILKNQKKNKINNLKIPFMCL